MAKGHTMSADVFVVQPRWTVQALHLRCALKRTLALHPAHVWSGADSIKIAVAMVPYPQNCDWVAQGQACADRKAAPDVLECWTEMEDQAIEACRAACHAEGLHWGKRVAEHVKNMV